MLNITGGDAMNKQTHEWQLYACHTSYCRADRWLVRQSHEQSELWHVASLVAGVPWLVAAVEPVCPFCGTTLVAAVEKQPFQYIDEAA